jgi:hypothetical protein
MNGFDTQKYTEKSRRDVAFDNLRVSSFSFPNERQVIRYSDVEPVMINDEEFKLDDKGRVVYRSVYFLASPIDIHGHRVRARAEREEERADEN